MFKLLLFLPIFLFSIPIFAKPSLKSGQAAPDFSLYGDDGKIHKLTDYRNKNVVLYFYPKNFTPGCTKQACSLRNDFNILNKNDTVVIGISNDSIESHKKFKEKYHLPFTLLSDPKSEVFALYGAKGFFINSRITYLINKSGIITHILSNITPEKHAQEIAEYFDIKKKGTV
jgi:thioredoxin-dependent peroxiredoxin